MMVVAGKDPNRAKSLRAVIDDIFGRWPFWPWSVLGLLVAGGVAGMAAGNALRSSDEEHQAALGQAACAGYGLVAAAMLSLLPRLAKLTLLWRNAVRRPANVDGSWWPLHLLAPALVATPRLRRTHQEFRSAVETTAGQARSILADRLWPFWLAAFVAPVLGLITAWQNGAKVQLRLQQGEEIKNVFPALLMQVSPPMVATIAASLALMVAIVVIDQLSKGLLRRWSGIIENGDGDHPSVIEMLGREEFREVSAPTRSAVPPAPVPLKGTSHPLDPDELEHIWRNSESNEK